MADNLEAGWYPIDKTVNGFTARAEFPEGRRSIVLFDAIDCGASHIGYFNGNDWEDVQAVNDD